MSRKTYPSDVSDMEWLILAPLIPAAKPGGRPRNVDMREILNAIFYIIRSGWAWRMLAHDFPAWQPGYGYFRTWRKDGLGEKMNEALREAVREQAGRASEPSAAILESQSVKTTETKGERGYDAHKTVTGRQRHIFVDGMGLLLVVLGPKADIQERAGAKLLLQRAVTTGFARLQLIWTDGGYSGSAFRDWVWKLAGWGLEVVKRPEGTQGFTVLARRWIVERTFGWLGRCLAVNPGVSCLMAERLGSRHDTWCGPYGTFHAAEEDHDASSSLPRVLEQGRRGDGRTRSEGCPGGRPCGRRTQECAGK